MASQEYQDKFGLPSQRHARTKLLPPRRRAGIFSAEDQLAFSGQVQRLEILYGSWLGLLIVSLWTAVLYSTRIVVSQGVARHDHWLSWHAQARPRLYHAKTAVSPQ
jgi:hypothetical protein